MRGGVRSDWLNERCKVRRFQRRAREVALGVLALLSGGCGAATAPNLSHSVAGTYSLDASSHRGGPTTGSFVLTRFGEATRRVQYPLAGGGMSELTAAGSFTLVGPDSIVFALREQNGGDANYVWRVRGVRTGTSFIIRYPHPADGEVVELYRQNQ